MSRKKLVAMCVVCVATYLIHVNTGSGKWTAVLMLIAGAATLATAIRALLALKRGERK